MNILLTYNLREYVEVLSFFAKEVHVANNSIRNHGVVNHPKIFSFNMPVGSVRLTIKFIAKYLIKHQIDVIFAQGTRDLLVYAAGLHLAHCSCRIVVTSHSSYTWAVPWKPPVILGLTRLLADAFIFLADCHYNRWHGYCDRIGLATFKLGNSVDIQRFQAKTDLQQPKSWNLGYVGVLRKQKGQFILTEAAHLLNEQGVAVNVHLAGDIMSNAYREELEEQIRCYRLESAVHIYGRIEPDRVPAFLSALNLYVCPSLMEMMPFNVLEAMASGLPIVSTSVGGIPDAVRSGIEGFLAVPCNAKALAESILKAMEPTIYPKLSVNSRHRAESKYSHPVMAGQLKVVFEKICMVDSPL